MFLSKINPNLKRTLLVIIGGITLYVAARGCFRSSNSEGELEKRIAAVEQTVEAKQYPVIVDDVIRGLPQHPEYANALLEAGINIAEKNNSYSDKARKEMWDFAVNKMEKKPELTDYLGPNAQHHMKRKAIHDSASKVVENVYDGVKEGMKIIKGE